MSKSISRSIPKVFPSIRRSLLLLLFVGVVGVLFALLSDSATAKEAPATPLGLVSERPTSGKFIETSAGFMVPYTETIPGTDVKFEMVPIAGGTFLMGSPAGEAERLDDEGPQVEVTVPPMWVAKYEVTWSEYKQFMKLCGIFEKFEDQGIRQIQEENEIDAITAPSNLYEPGFTYSVGQGPRQPAITMSQYAAKQYTKWLSLLTSTFYRLPTEAEWEYACRAGSTTAYSFGDDPAKLDDYAWHYDISDDETHPVGEKKPNAWGLYDMHGNASEWVLDSYGADWYKQIKKEAEPTPAAAALATSEKLYPRVLRGGSWFLDPPDCRSAMRRQSDDDNWRTYDPNVPKSPWWFASDESQDVGFRIVRPLEAVARADREKFWEADVKSIFRVSAHRIDNEGKGERGYVDPDLPAAIKAMKKGKAK